MKQQQRELKNKTELVACSAPKCASDTKCHRLDRQRRLGFGMIWMKEIEVERILDHLMIAMVMMKRPFPFLQEKNTLTETNTMENTERRQAMSPAGKVKSMCIRGVEKSKQTKETSLRLSCFLKS